MTDRSIRAGADDDGEMGVLHALFQPQRETNLRIRLEEYLRFGLHAGRVLRQLTWVRLEDDHGYRFLKSSPQSAARLCWRGAQAGRCAARRRRQRAGRRSSTAACARWPATCWAAPRCPQRPPNAFKIAVAGSTLTIGKGRLYVDGLLAENHGAPSTDPAKRVFDDLLAEPQFADPI